jgi:hypothetical protein
MNHKEVLDEYKYLDIRYYLDGRYFNKVLSDRKEVVKKQLVIKFNDDKILDNFNELDIDYEDDYSIIRLIIEVDSRTHNHKGHKVITGSRHCNLLVIDHKDKVIIRFEPLDDFLSDEDEEDLQRILEDKFPEYEYVVDENHPQQRSFKDFLCNAYVLKYAYDYVSGNPIEFEYGENTEDDIKKFAKAVEFEYGVLPDDEEPDAEFGYYDGSGILLGGLGGALIGGAVGGGTGALVGGLGGALLGGALTSSRYDRSQNYYNNSHHHHRYNQSPYYGRRY